MQFRIIALGKVFDESSRVSMLCQQSSKDELGFTSFGTTFNWEIDKADYTEEMAAKLQELVDGKTILERPFVLQEVKRTNVNTGEIVTKLVAGVR
jgi:hypothetical protein